jgi:hypothetical protein
VTNKIISFTVNSEKNKIEGVLITGADNNSIQLTHAISGSHSINLDSTNIKDEGNFIASVIRRLDLKKEYKSITLTDSQDTYEIIQPPSKTLRLYVQRSETLEDNIALRDEHIKITDYLGKKHLVNATDIGFKAVDIPINFKYCKSNILNAIYKANLMPHDFDRKLSKTILEAIARNKSDCDGAYWSFYAIGGRTYQYIPSSVDSDNRHKYVFVNSEMIKGIDNTN